MQSCCSSSSGEKPVGTDPSRPSEPVCCAGGAGTPAPARHPDVTWFDDMISRNYAHACAEKEKGAKLVGILCEYTPREVVMAAGAWPVCLCGGSAEMIPAAERELPANLCPLIKSTYGYSMEKANPFLEMADLIVAETTCDGKKKMYELLARRHPMVLLELPQKSGDADAFEHWVKEIRKLQTELEHRFGVTVTEKRLRDAIVLMNRERGLRRKLAELMRHHTPPLTGRELLNMKSLISGIPADLERYEQALTRLPGRSPVEQADQRVRVLLTGAPVPHGAERIVDLLEAEGGLVVCQENCTGLKPLLEDVEADAADPVRAIAAKYFHLPCSVMTRNDRRLDTLRALADEYRADCVVELVWQTCLTYDIESGDVKRLAEQALNRPYLKIVTDYSPADSARIALRVQALYETVRAA